MPRFERLLRFHNGQARVLANRFWLSAGLEHAVLVNERQAPVAGQVLRSGRVPQNARDQQIVVRRVLEFPQEVSEHFLVSGVAKHQPVGHGGRHNTGGVRRERLEQVNRVAVLLDAPLKRLLELVAPLGLGAGVLPGAGVEQVLQQGQQLRNAAVALATQPHRLERGRHDVAVAEVLAECVELLLSPLHRLTDERVGGSRLQGLEPVLERPLERGGGTHRGLVAQPLGGQHHLLPVGNALSGVDDVGLPRAPVNSLHAPVRRLGCQVLALGGQVHVVRALPVYRSVRVRLRDGVVVLV